MNMAIKIGGWGQGEADRQKDGNPTAVIEIGGNMLEEWQANVI